MIISNGSNFAEDICKALQIKPEGITNLTLSAPANSLVKVTIERCLGRDDAKRLNAVLEQYTLLSMDSVKKMTDERLFEFYCCGKKQQRPADANGDIKCEVCKSIRFIVKWDGNCDCKNCKGAK